MRTADIARLRLGLGIASPDIVALMRRERQASGSSNMQADNDARLADYYARLSGRDPCTLPIRRAP